MSNTSGDHFHNESLEAFTSELAAAGFEAVNGYRYPVWRGEIHPDFAALTDAAQMDIVIRPGWPFQSPALMVQGLNTNHSTPGGLVCMWQDDDNSLEWTTLDGFYSRISEWCHRAMQGWENDDLAADAYLNFQPKCGIVATFDFPALRTAPGAWGEGRGVVDPETSRVDLQPGRRDTNHLRVLWFHVGTLNNPPPRSLSEVSGHLPRPQRKGLQRALAERRIPTPFVPSGGCDIILFCWERNGRPNLLVMACAGMGDNMEAAAMLAGPTDEQNLMLRAGPDAALLRTRRAAVFGAGALGGYAAAAIAQSGLGFMDLVDGDMLLPGNVARHVAGHQHVGKTKTTAVQAIVNEHAPWTIISAYHESPFTPHEISRRIENADIIIDATGNAAFTYSLAMTASDAGKPLVSGALYRGGAVARVQRQALASDTPIHQRDESEQYPSIPLGIETEEFATADTGCSAPVNNAPPASVMACASRIAQVAVDALTGRFDYGDEIIEVYRPLEDHPFDRIGPVVVNGNAAE